MEWLKRYEEAKLQEYNILNEEDPNIKLRELEDELENNLILLGATALEDKLQVNQANCMFF